MSEKENYPLSLSEKINGILEKKYPEFNEEEKKLVQAVVMAENAVQDAEIHVISAYRSRGLYAMPTPRYRNNADASNSTTAVENEAYRIKVHAQGYLEGLRAMRSEQVLDAADSIIEELGVNEKSNNFRTATAEDNNRHR